MNSLICPVCHDSLQLTSDCRSLRCINRHLFDISRQGYVNLLLSHQRKSKQPGDSPEMVTARRHFLNLGHYRPIIETIVNLANTGVSPTTESLLWNYCDIGCGEGYYSDLLHRAFTSDSFFAGRQVQSSGIDISAAAIKAACKRNQAIQWLIASGSHLPIESASQDLLSCLFFNLDINEAARILKPGGALITVSAGPKHLIELRERLYDQIKAENKTTLANDNPQALQLTASQTIMKQFRLNTNDEITQLLTMTPHFWRSRPERKQQLSSISHLELTLDVRVDLYRRAACEP